MQIQPQDPSKGHFVVSLLKSGLRLCACVSLYQGDLVTTASLFGLAEVLGIAEEMV